MMKNNQPKVKVPKVPNVKCRTEEQCKQISETLRDAYRTGRRFRKVGFKQPPKG